MLQLGLLFPEGYTLGCTLYKSLLIVLLQTVTGRALYIGVVQTNVFF